MNQQYQPGGSWPPPPPPQNGQQGQWGYQQDDSPDAFTAYQMMKDDEHLNLLKVFHYVLGGITGLASCIFLFHIVMGLMIATRPGFAGPASAVGPPPSTFGYLFAAFGSVAMLSGWIWATLNCLAARFIGQRRNHTFIVVVAALNCLSVPIGTILGVFTLVVVLRPSVKALFQGSSLR